MEAEIVTREPLRVVGILSRINPAEADWQALWERGYMPRDAEISPHSIDGGWYGLYYETGQEPLLDFVAGRAVGPDAPVGEGLEARDVPAGAWAAFDSEISSLGATWDRIFSEWLPASPEWQHDPAKPCFEWFPPEVATGGQAVRIFASVKPR